MLAAAATIASIAVPPASSTSRPASAAARCGALIAPRYPIADVSTWITRMLPVHKKRCAGRMGKSTIT
jgi:hypothetical protein